MTSLSLVSGFVASLLALRSNQGLSRLMEARMAFGKVVLYTRDMSSLVANFVYPKNPALGLKLARHLACYSWLLKNFLRGREVSGDDQDLIRTMLSPADADYVLRQRKMPVAVVMRLRQALAQMTATHQLSTAEEIAIDHTIQSMGKFVYVATIFFAFIDYVVDRPTRPHNFEPVFFSFLERHQIIPLWLRNVSWPRPFHLCLRHTPVVF
jgi:predicted membrane chloride channel (bestrophin family)